MKSIQVEGLDKKVSQLIMGSVMYSSDNMDYACEMLDAYISLGGNTIDMAYDYGEKVEQAIGNWVKLRNNREDVVLIGKGAHHDANGPRVNAKCIASDLHESLERAQLDYFDIYLLHRDDVNVPVGPIIEALNEHKEAGRIKAFGTSNWTYERIQEANEYAKANGLSGFVMNSPNLSLAKQKEPRWPGCISVDQDYANKHEASQLPLFSWSSQAAGFFTGRFSPERRDNEQMVRVYYSDENWERLRRAEQIASEKGVSAIQIALAFVLNQPFPTCAIIGPQKVSEIKSSVDGAELKLTAEERKWLDLQE